MADLGLSLGIPHTAPGGAIGQRPHSNPRKQEQPKHEHQGSEKNKQNLQPFPLINQGHAQKASQSGGKGALVDIVA